MKKRAIGVYLIAALLCVVVAGCSPTEETVARTTDQTKLAKIAVEDKDEDVRRAARDTLSSLRNGKGDSKESH